MIRRNDVAQQGLDMMRGSAHTDVVEVPEMRLIPAHSTHKHSGLGCKLSLNPTPYSLPPTPIKEMRLFAAESDDSREIKRANVADARSADASNET